MAEPTTGSDPTATGEPTPPEPTPATEPQTPAVAQTTEPGAQDHMIPKTRLDEVLARAKAAEAELKKFQKDQAEAERKAAEEQGKFEELYKTTQAKLEAAEKAAAEAIEAKRQAELATIRSQAAAKHKLPPLWAERLRGDTQDEIEADAAALAETMPKPTVSTATDATAGVNSQTPSPGSMPSDAQINEMAARYGVRFQDLKDVIKQQLGVQ